MARELETRGQDKEKQKPVCEGTAAPLQARAERFPAWRRLFVESHSRIC